LLPNSASVDRQVLELRNVQKVSEEAMQERDNQERRSASDSRLNLDNRYGKIGISAVAAAVCHQGEPQRVVHDRRTATEDCD
jgi:hypothetical protein